MNASDAGSIVIGLGSNVGDRLQMLDQAVSEMKNAGLTIIKRSRIYTSRAWGVKDQPDFLNAAVSVAIDLPARELLKLLIKIEQKMGRVRGEHWGPRVIDLDLLLYRDKHIDEPGLKVPHPRIAERDFVLQPLIDLGILHDKMAGHLGALPENERTILSRSEWKSGS
jgi:2-amino-4-hydroxy-6-hydroxymethyldihydropteridine diphosphokinase